MTETIIDLGYRPREWQRQCHRKRKRFSVRVLHRRAGKTELAIVELMNAALRCTLDLSHFAYIAPFLRQAKGIAWDRLKAYARKVPGTDINEAELWVRFAHNYAKVQIFGGDNPDGLRGLRLDGVVVDEVAQIKPELWNEILRPALSDRMGWALFIGTPKGVNLFSELYYKALELPDWDAQIYTVYETETLPADEVERLRRDLSINEFNREYLCDFTASATNQVMGLNELEDAAQRHLRTEEYSWAPRILGVDVARFGDDKSVIMPRQGLVMFEPEVFSGLDNMAFASMVARKIVDWQADTTFVDVGNGTGVIDRLRQLGFRVVEVNFGGKADDPRYVNKRTEMFFSYAEWIRAGGCIPNVSLLKQDSAAPTYDYDPQNRLRLESKDDIKKRLKRSNDLSDAAALTFAYPVSAKRLLGASSRPAMSIFFDPEVDE